MGTGYLATATRVQELSWGGSSLLAAVVSKRKKAVIYEASFQAFRIAGSSTKAVRAYPKLLNS